MSKVKTCLNALIRWSWFGLLVLLAFGYLVSGLSRPHGETVPMAREVRVEAVQQPALRGAQSLGSSFDSALETLNRSWEASLHDQDLQAAPMADWLTVCRRLSLALVGNGLALEEIRQLQRLPESERERVHLKNLLADSRFHHYWSERWARYLVGTDGGQFIVYRRRRFRIWLAEVLATNRPYDQIVRQLITAEGLWTDKPEVNFLTATFDSNDGKPDPIRMAARTSRAFLGLRIDCLQCHDDFLGNVNLGHAERPRAGTQSDFHQLAAFFTSAKASGLQGVKSGEVDYDYKYLNAESEQSVDPAVPYLAELLPNEGDPRHRLAAWITHPENRQAARAAVSHVWALMFGKPIGEAVDNLPLDEPVHPMLTVLADEFVDSGYNLHRLISLIACSSPFRVDSRSEFEITPRHEQAYAVFPLVRLRPEQVAGSLIQAARIKKTDRESSLFLQFQKMTGTNDFVRQYGDIGEDEFTIDSVTITQRLLMMNGKMTSEIVESNPVLNTTAHIAMFASDDHMAIETAYLCALNRYPSSEETEHFSRRLAETDDRGEAIEDLIWILLNSSELAWNH